MNPEQRQFIARIREHLHTLQLSLEAITRSLDEFQQSIERDNNN
jgi:hypothetical protein